MSTNIYGRSVHHSRCAAKSPAPAVEGAASAGVSRLPSATGSGRSFFLAGGCKSYPPGLTDEDAAILARLPRQARADYRLADLFDAMHIVCALKVCGSAVEAVGIDEACKQLREQRARS